MITLQLKNGHFIKINLLRGEIDHNLGRRPSLEVEGGSEQDTAYDMYNGGIKAINAIVWAHAINKIDVTNEAYVAGIQTAVETLSRNLEGY